MTKKTKQDPTGQAANRKKATSRLQTRLSFAERRVKQLFRIIPRTRRREAVLPNAKIIPVYDYQITAAELEELERRIGAILDDELLETQFNRMPPNWWWQSVIEGPYRQGTAEEIVEFNQMITAEIIRIRTERGIPTQRLEIGQVLQSSEYLAALDRIHVADFNKIKSLDEVTASQVVGAINRGIGAGNSPTDIVKTITERFDVSRSRAEGIAHTSINEAYNNARLDATNVAAAQTGLRAGVIHLSALLPTTRAEHGDRHGNAYTTAQQRQWWDSGTNRIRCHCSTRSALIDQAGNVIDVELQQEIQAEREFFDK
jgi:hypothetical protein